MPVRFNFSIRYLSEEIDIKTLWRCLVACPEEDAAHLDDLTFEDAYKPWPFRAYAFVDDSIDLVAEPHACELHISDLRSWILAKLGSSE